jgi:hypothetical protein
MSESNEEDLVGAAYRLLKGTASRDENGLPRQKYLEENSLEEKAGRRALALLLGSDKPLDGLIRRQLAALFDPAFRPKDEENKAPERRIEFTQPSRRAVEHNRRLFIGFQLWLKMGMPKKDDVLDRGTKARATKELSARYQIDESTIGKAYKYAMTTRWIG